MWILIVFICVNTFLGNVAEYLYDRYGSGISDVRIVLPNTRSKLFFMDALGGMIDRPVWQPHYVTIDDLMREVSGLAPVDRVRAVVELYGVYSRYHKESFDSFYFWGEMLLNDFDQVDKYMVDAEMLFSNIYDLKDIDFGTSYFNSDQLEVVRRFWDAFGREDGLSSEKRDFLSIWRSLGAIYHEFRNRLAASGVAYTGMMHREAASKIKRGEVSAEWNYPVAVVGFNALSECEKVLFDHLKNVCDAEFFWDYDDYYLLDRHQEAGLFVRGNLARYPQPAGFVNRTDNFSGPKKVRAVSVPSGAIQCKYAADFLRDVAAGMLDGRVPGKETAIVLTDENLLLPLLYSIPKEIGELNVTMGYPLRQTLAYSFAERLLRLQVHTRGKGGQTAFYHADATGILSHPFVAGLEGEKASAIRADIISKSRIYVSESAFRTGGVVEAIFRKQEDWRGVADWLVEILSAVTTVPVAAVSTESAGDEIRFRREYAGIIADTVRRLSNSLSECEVDMNVMMFSSLVRRVLQNVRVPYEGEPLRGIQIMGILETRNLDFDNVMIMSMNDDNFPGNPAATSSFIPYNLRFGYGLPTPQHHDGVYAYYFYRLLQRASLVDMVYCSRSDENSSGEQSRYIYQLEYESSHDVERVDFGLDVGISPEQPIVVGKDTAVMTALAEYLDGGGRTMSPTALNAYLDCPLKFYFRYVARLKPDDEVNEDIDMPMFGTILHKAMELLYRPLVGRRDPSAAIRSLIGSEAVTAAVDDAIGEAFYHGEKFSADDCEGGLLMVRDIVIRYINRNILPFDSRLEGFTVEALEYDLDAEFGFETKDGRHSIVFGGMADRVDMLSDGSVRIVDYKTGSPHADFAGVGALFDRDDKGRNPAVLQTLLYSMIVTRMQESGGMPGHGVCPVLYYVRLMNRPDYSPVLKEKGGSVVSDYEPYREDFEEGLGRLLGELFDGGAPFVQCEDTKPCAYCDFAVICRRN